MRSVLPVAEWTRYLRDSVRHASVFCAAHGSGCGSGGTEVAGIHRVVYMCVPCAGASSRTEDLVKAAELPQPELETAVTEYGWQTFPPKGLGGERSGFGGN